MAGVPVGGREGNRLVNMAAFTERYEMTRFQRESDQWSETRRWPLPSHVGINIHILKYYMKMKFVFLSLLDSVVVGQTQKIASCSGQEVVNLMG